MLPFEFYAHVMIMFTSLAVTASAHPVALRAPPAERDILPPGPLPLQNAQVSMHGPSNSTPALHTPQDLYEGNKKFRQNILVQEAKVAEKPSFMFLGCLDNKLSADRIFNTPPGSTISHTNIANQYQQKDSSAKAAVQYAVESMHVQHIIVLGHYGCKGVEQAITNPRTSSRSVRSWLKPISYLYSKSRRTEIVQLRDSRMPQRGKPDGVETAPAANDPGFRALVEENVKHSVKELREHGIFAKAYSKHILSTQNEDNDVFVHGLVFDEVTGEVRNLGVSFGPPGKAIPTIPFKAVAAAKNFHRNNDRPGISRGKTWDFSAHSH